MTVLTTAHRIDLGQSGLGVRPFADFYRVGEARSAVPLVCFWGGAIPSADYERRRIQPSATVVTEYVSALGGRRPAPDLLVFELPEVVRCSSDVLRRWFARVFGGILSKSPNPQPSAIGYVAHSAGAFPALGLALDWPASRAIATLGGVGMNVVLLDTPERPRRGLAMAAFANTSDPCADQTLLTIDALSCRGLDVSLWREAGGHHLGAYVHNGSLRRAFGFVIDHLLPRRRRRRYSCERPPLRELTRTK